MLYIGLILHGQLFQKLGYKTYYVQRILKVKHNHTVSSVFDSPMATNNNKFDEKLKIIGDILQGVSIDDHRMADVDFVDVGSETLAFNEQFDTCGTIVIYDANEEREEEEDDDDDIQYRTKNIPQKLTEALEMMQKSRLFSSTKQLQLHHLICEL